MMMTDNERTVFRRKIGHAIIDIQNEERAKGRETGEVVLEIIAALLSFSVYVVKNNTGMSADDFRAAANVAIEEEWPGSNGSRH